jgi:hypothetical protein
LVGAVGGAFLADIYDFSVAFGVVGGSEVVVALVALPFLLRLGVR